MAVKLLSKREMEIFKVAVRWRKAYEDSNPDVGMGVTTQTIAEELAASLSFKIDPDDVAEVCEEVGGS